MSTDATMSTRENRQPSRDMERAVAALWSEVLQRDELPGSADNFFSLGGDSMAMVILEFRIGEEFAVQLPAGAVLGAPVLRDLCALIETTRGGARTT